MMMPLSYEGGHKEKILGSNESSSLTEELLAMNASLCFDSSILPMVWLVHLGVSPFFTVDVFTVDKF